MDIPEVIPNPAVLPKQAPGPGKPPAKPVEKPDKVPAERGNSVSPAFTENVARVVWIRGEQAISPSRCAVLPTP
jgi:hypothetical protein